MLKRLAILAATTAAVAISLVGAQGVWAADPVQPALGPSAQPTASATPGSASTQESMPGMSDEEMAGMNKEATAAASQDQMAGMNDEEMAGMKHEGTESDSSHTGTETTSEPRPLALVVGGFAAVTGAVLVTAGLMRRRDKRLAGSSPKTSRSAK